MADRTQKNAPLRVLMFGWEYPPYNSGGLGVACKGLVEALAADGVEVTFVLPKRIPVTDTSCRFIFADDSEEMVTKEGTPVLLSAYLTAEEYRLRREKYGGSGAYTIYEAAAEYAENARAIARDHVGEFDVIHAHDWLTFGAGIAAKEELGKPLVAHVHATEFDRGGGNQVNEYVYGIERKGIEAADQVVSVSAFTKNILTTHYGVDDQKIMPIHNGFNAAEYAPDKIATDHVVQLKRCGYNIVLFVGRLTLQKGPDYFVQTAARILDHEPSTIFVVAGSGDMHQRMLRDVAAAGLSNKFIFAGFARGADLAQLYKAADLYIMPSVSEPFGITPLESLINGTPVLISKQSGVSECLTNALTVDFWDVEEATNKAVSVLRHPGLKKTLSKNGYQDALQQTWQKAADKVRELYATMVLVTKN
ncbi:MAG: glycosyltransferase family 4 protein [Candidatus Paceibacterota bacterium]